MVIFDSLGKSINLGSQLGSGGEGVVHEVPELGKDIVAKIYHKAIPLKKQQKLIDMANISDDSLKKIAAWPFATLHLNKNGPVQGFLMTRANGEPVHQIYSPGQRKQNFPDKDWAFLINVARNTAAAFQAIHVRGHIIGDVNPNLVYVSENTIAKLIDCDSFQIHANSQSYLCEVGVPFFTPPELQSLTTFENLTRTKNHDNFGLALLIFHILLMGRHPFSGRHAGKGDVPLEKAIANLKYVFSKDSLSRGVSPPPNPISPKILSSTLYSYFERAFLESGISHARPTGAEWVAALDEFRLNLQTCRAESIHKYYRELIKCPWCELEQASGIPFFISQVKYNSGTTTLNIEITWGKILSVKKPLDAPFPRNLPSNPVGKPLPPQLSDAKNLAIVKKAIAIVIVIGTIAYLPSILVLTGFLSLWLFFSGYDDSSERNLRRNIVDQAKSDLGSLNKIWDSECNDSKFQTKITELKNAKEEYLKLPQDLTTAKQQLHIDRRNNQLHKFLDKHFIQSARIPSIGTSRKITLASYGIESAADITRNKIQSIPGFGYSLSNELVNWRKKIEAKFVFNAAAGIDPKDLIDLQNRFSQRKSKLEAMLNSGPQTLNDINNATMKRRAELMPLIKQSCNNLAQAEADLAML